MKQVRLLGSYITVIALTVLVFGVSSCKKPGDTVAKVLVVKASDGVTPVVGATVMLSATTDPAYPNEPREGVDKETTTNSSGNATFNYNEYFKRGQAGLFVLDVTVEKDGVISEGIIKIVEEETSEATVEINVP